MKRPSALAAGTGRLDAALARGEQADAPDEAWHGEATAITYTEQMDEGRTFSIGPEVEAALGYTQAEWMADPLLWVKLLHPRDRERVVDLCSAANQSLDPFRAEYRMIARDGREVWIRDRAEVLYSLQGRPMCWQGVMVVSRSSSR